MCVQLKSALLPFPQEMPHPGTLNDSGCPLGDTEHFDNGLDDEEEESLDAIRAAVKQKMKKHKVQKHQVV